MTTKEETGPRESEKKIGAHLRCFLQNIEADHADCEIWRSRNKASGAVSHLVQSGREEGDGVKKGQSLRCERGHY